MDKKNKNPNVPNLRFLQFTNEWSKFAVSELLNTYPTNSLSWDKLSYIEKSKIKNIHYGIIHNGFKSTIINGNNQFIPFVNNSFTPKSYTLLQDGDLILADASEDRKDVGRPVEMINVDNQKIISGLHTIHARNKTNLLINGFKGFYFQSYAMKKQIYKIANGSKIYGISPANFNELFISVPSKEEQQKIVNLLQKIEDRIETQIKIIKDLKMQRDHLIHSVFSSMNSKLLLITDIAEVYQPQTISSEKFDEGAEFPVFGANGIIGHYEKYNHENEQICIACRGSSVGTINISKKKSWITGNSMVINSDNYDDMIDKKFLYYQLMFIDFYKYISGSGQPQITRESLKNLKIKVPSLAIQHSISNFLNHIDLKITIEAELLCQYQLQKSYLLKNMFI